MDVFEQWLNMSWEKNAKERKQITNEKRAVCICPACLSYNRCAQENHELLYCIAGKSMLCISEDAGCTCRKCPVTLELGLTYHDFCLKGAEAAQRYEHEVH
ncbi:MAG: DUF2769 domain-containing protein [Methanoregula sp.]|jgi:hypothetical protein|nr:DUF2769 domain-containing protein [Methanoregula sp.]